MFATKVRTSYAAPEQAILDGTDIVPGEAALRYGDLKIVMHGTTLATNALIERRGAKVAFITTEGVPRRDRDAHGKPVRPIWPEPATADAAGSTRRPFFRHGADWRAGAGTGPAGRGGVAGAGLVRIANRSMTEASISRSGNSPSGARSMVSWSRCCAPMCARPIRWWAISTRWRLAIIDAAEDLTLGRLIAPLGREVMAGMPRHQVTG